MFSQFLGHFLLSEGILDAETLNEVMKYQDTIRLKMGVLAIEMKYLSVEQVEEIHNAQARQDKRFGEIAIEKRYLDTDQLDELLSMQKSEHLRLIQALVDKEVFTTKEAEEILEKYKVKNQLTDEAMEIMKRDDVDGMIDIFLDFDEAFDQEACRDYYALLIRNMIRFVDRNIWFEEMQKTKDYRASYLITQVIEGRDRIMTGIAGDVTTLLQFAAQFADEDLEEMDDMMEDAVGEFLNLHNGIFTVNMSDQGREMELEPQVFLSNAVLDGNIEYYIVPVYFSYGKIDFIMGPV